MNLKSKLICLTSACGGVGTTASAICLGRSLSRFKEINTLYISLDFLGCKTGNGGASKLQLYDALISEDNNFESIRSSVSEDKFGLHYLSFAELINPLYSALDKLEILIEALSDDYDCIIVDCPSNCSLGLAVYRLCDVIVVVDGLRTRQNPYSEKLTAFLSIFAPNSSIINFSFEEDTDGFESGEADIHGQFGAEVRRLAEEIFSVRNICS